MRLLLAEALLVLSLLFVRPVVDAAWRLRLMLHGLLLAACLLAALVDGAGAWACLIGIVAALLQPALLHRFVSPDAGEDAAPGSLSRRDGLRLLGALLLVALAMRLLPATLPTPSPAAVPGTVAGISLGTPPGTVARVPPGTLLVPVAGTPPGTVADRQSGPVTGMLPETMTPGMPGAAGARGGRPVVGRVPGTAVATPGTLAERGAGTVVGRLSDPVSGSVPGTAPAALPGTLADMVPGALPEAGMVPGTVVTGRSAVLRALLSVALGILLVGLLGACCAGSAMGRIGALLLVGNGLLLVACQLPGLDLLSLGSLLLLQGGLLGQMIRAARSRGLSGDAVPEGT